MHIWRYYIVYLLIIQTILLWFRTRRYRSRGIPTHIVGTNAVCGKLGGQVMRKMRVDHNIIYFFRSLTTCGISSEKKLIYFLYGNESVIECNFSSFNNDGFDGFLTKHNFSRKFYLYVTPQMKYRGNELISQCYFMIIHLYIYITYITLVFTRSSEYNK